jgi:radical SAM protein with 4Fe4S-binding SPASM domain
MSAHPKFEAPLYLAWEVTLRCNANCIHCYSNSGPGVIHPGELSTAAALNVIDQLADSGLLILAFSGGEPLLRKDIFKLIEHAVDKDLIVNIATNGAIITDTLANRLKQSGVRSITVSLDGANSETHENFRRHPGLFPKTIRAIETLVKHDHRVVVSFTPTVINHAEGPAVVRLSYDLGASAVNMSEYVPAGRGSRSLSLSPELLRSVVHQWIDMRREYKNRMQIIWHDCRVALLVPPEEQDRYSGCGAGKLTARLMVDGTLTPCVFISTPVGKLTKESFQSIWSESPLLKAIRNRDLTPGTNCGSCEYKLICGGCRAAAMSFHSDLMAGDPSCWLVKDPPVSEASIAGICN